jgi:hypothetical protein
MAMAVVGAVCLDATDEEKNVLASDLLKMLPRMRQFRDVAEQGQLIGHFKKGQRTTWTFSYTEIDPPDAA